MEIVTSKKFDLMVNKRIDRCKAIMKERAKEYATEDRLYNCKRAAVILEKTVSDAVLGMMAKHLVSLLDMAQYRRPFSRAMFDEKLTDLHNYLYILESAIETEKEDQARKAIAKDLLKNAQNIMQQKEAHTTMKKEAHAPCREKEKKVREPRIRVSSEGPGHD